MVAVDLGQYGDRLGFLSPQQSDVGFFLVHQTKSCHAGQIGLTSAWKNGKTKISVDPRMSPFSTSFLYIGRKLTAHTII